MKNILVTGGAGFIGTNFVYYITGKGYNVTVLDKLTYAGGKDNLEPLIAAGKVRFVEGDICDKDIVVSSLKGCDSVIHFAAESHNTRSETDPDLFYRTNVHGTKVVLESAFEGGVKKFIHISTDEVYGSIVDGYFAEGDKKLGDSQATSAYSKSKSQADDLAMEFGRNYPVVVLRPTNNFGPWQYPEKALPRWISNIILGEKIPLWGEGLQVRDWLYAPLTAECLEFLLEKGEAGNAYNVAANHNPEITNRQAAEWICEMLGVDKNEWIQYIPDPRPNHDFRYALNVDKITSLGFKPAVDPYAQFKATVEWYKANAEWWKKRKEEAESIYK
ncbi:MAG TPA: NAD-dependent epimerase/dehydratase family protein [Ignavibacteria bacterium]|nr:dTDP-glucose 4,6-dehydratase [Bacteroidota bacterium]HRE11014.1 NAD-dependent epimerase/dehydratase family protein [Ignavibacteria bacterium]HRF65221.1 NAD-dependent epimerase/dehydratase family protein [Ignavibacteria bacterium]HRJ05587.1 NAD-dependent epimerase/dehydratase family protein [Ignavibacteria bacterium]HRJ85815.1 NAD-dependent epimerase/dehydratase family protein [Ignavibacteria bacterium]